MVTGKIVAIAIVLGLFVHLKYPQWTFGFLCLLVTIQVLVNVWRKLARRLRQWALDKKSSKENTTRIKLTVQRPTAETESSSEKSEDEEEEEA